MAQLSSPGVSVQVIDESFYTSAAPGTVPLIIVASEENKQNGAATGTAPGTLKANAGKVYLLTSQKDLSDTFGIPKFITDANNNPVHAGEQNEYGLQAAYSYLGVSNRAYVVRADIDLAQLNKTSIMPVGKPVDGSFWFDIKNSKYGIFEWNSATADVIGGQTFTNKIPLVITDINQVDTVNGVENTPKSSIGAPVGSYALVAVSTLIKLWFKKPATYVGAADAGTWVEVGSDAWAASWPTVQGTISSPVTNGTNASTLTINTVNCTGATLDALVTYINAQSIAGVKAASINGKLTLYSTDATTISISGNMLSALGMTAATYNAPALTIAPHTQPPAYRLSDDNNPTGSIWIKTTTPNLGASWTVTRYNSAVQAWSSPNTPLLYKDHITALAALDSTGGGINLPLNTLYVKYNDLDSDPVLANFKIYRRGTVGPTTIKSIPILDNTFGSHTMVSFTVSESATGSNTWVDHSETDVLLSVGADSAIANAEALATAINSLGGSVTAFVAVATNQLVIQHENGGDIKIADGTNTPFAVLFGAIDPNTGLTPTTNLYGDMNDNYIATLWTALSDDKTAGFATASASEISATTANGQLWYNSITDDVDIMVHNGTTWIGYRNADLGEGVGATDVNGPIVSATKPTTQSDGSTRLKNGDLWIDMSDLENYPAIYRFQANPKKWILVDTTDQSTDTGILFHDARWNTDGKSADASSIEVLLTNDFLDFDAPDPALYPKGMLLWNLRRSGFNVKKFVHNYVDLTARNLRNSNEYMGSSGTFGEPDYVAPYYPHRWISEAANQIDGAGTFGHKAQRTVVVQALQALVNSNQEIRDDESRIFNLIACPGYSELVGEMKNLNYDRGITAFVVADTPARLAPDATSLSNWGNNQNGAAEDNERGLVSSDEYLAFFYPWGYTSDNLGNNIAVPPSHMMLRTIALSDNASYPWFAPAGTRRGGITNADSVGYITSEGEFKTVALNVGQRDTLASIKVNAITFINGAGIVNFAQYTRAKNASSLDRINVARLVIQLRRQFAVLAKPYLFEPNDPRTRAELAYAAEKLLLELVGQRALYDYVVVCDETNNTPARIDRNELYLDVAIEPVKSVEFIYIPLRLKNTGEIKALG
jgi:hypothetical protein